MYPLTLSSPPVFPATVADIYSVTCSVDQDDFVREISKKFNLNPQWPGVILTSQNEFSGMVSRKHFFESLGKPFGIEIHFRQTIKEFHDQICQTALILQSNTSIQQAVKIALARNLDQVYDPIVIQFPNLEFRLLNMHTLLNGQNMLMENLYLHVQELSTIDPLTAIPNRRGFFESAQQTIDSSQKVQVNLSAFMIDIDHFKVINDLYGHFVGDYVIKTVAEECHKSLRSIDLLGRFGGEEFIALLPATPIEKAYQIAERLRKKIQELKIYIDSYKVSITVSIGVCHIDDANGSLDKLLIQSDHAMYAAKGRGRNQVVVWDSLLGESVRNDIHSPPTRIRLNKIEKSINQLEEARIYDETINGWAHALELRDKETMGHAQRVSSMTIELARKLGISEEELIDIRRGALLHDIGKIAIPDHILFKPGPLSEEEWTIMRRHPKHAFELLAPIRFLENALMIPYCHHEHWDGSGYPRGLKGEQIPYPARMFTIVDVWDALTSNRPYRKAWEPENVTQFIKKQAGKLFDPEIVPVFLDLLENSRQPKTMNILQADLSN